MTTTEVLEHVDTFRAAAARYADLAHREAELEAMNDALGQRLGRTRDFAEGPRAFLEKRKPQWSGS